MKLLIFIMVFFISGCYIKNKNTLYEIKKNELYIEKIWKKTFEKRKNFFYTNFLLYPILHKNIIYTISNKGYITAINILSGKKIWKKYLLKSNFNIYKKIITDGKNLFIENEKYEFYALNIKNKNIIWKKNIHNTLLCDPVIYKKHLLIFSDDGTLNSLNSKTGDIIWSINIPGFNKIISFKKMAEPLIKNNIIIIGNDYGYIYFIDATTGLIIFKKNIFEKENNIRSNKTLKNIVIDTFIINNILFISSYEKIVALNIKNGKIIWKKNNIDLKQKIIFDKNTIYILNNHNCINAINFFTGNIIWKNQFFLNINLTLPILYKKYFIIADNKGYINILKTENGVQVFKKKFSHYGFKKNFFIYDNIILIEDYNKQFFCFKIKK